MSGANQASNLLKNEANAEVPKNCSSSNGHMRLAIKASQSS